MADSLPFAELDPHWLHTPEGRGGLGVSFLCPHCVRLVMAHRLAALDAAAAEGRGEVVHHPSGDATLDTTGAAILPRQRTPPPPATVHSVCWEPHHEDPPLARIGVVFDIAHDREPHPEGFDHPHLRPAHPDGATAPTARWSHNGGFFHHVTLAPAIDCSVDGHWRGEVRDGRAVDAA